ncbi:MAG: hypothetical protein ACM3KR_06235 [Deltaproteobacteria bacterium]
MKKVKLICIIIVFMISFAGCGKKPAPAVNPNPVEHTKVLPNAEKQKTDTEIFDVKTDKVLSAYIDTLCPKDMSLMKCLIGDIDENGSPELVISFGDKSKKAINEIFLLKKRDSSWAKFENLKTNKNAIDIELTTLYKKDKKELSVIYQLKDKGKIYTVYSLKDKKLLRLSKLDSIFEYDLVKYGNIGEQDINITDTDKDGIDEIILKGKYGDVQEREVSLHIKWNGREFKQYKKEVKYVKGSFIYPDEPEKVVENYFESRLLGINEETNKLITDKN